MVDNIFRGVLGIKQRNMRKQRLSEQAAINGKSSTQSSLLPKKSSVAPPNVQDYGAKLSNQQQYQASQGSSSNSYKNQQPTLGKINLMGFGGGDFVQSQTPTHVPQYVAPHQTEYARPASAIHNRKQSSEDDSNQVEDENLEINDNPNEVRLPLFRT